ncbi:MAG: hypothetical protein AB7T49_02335 [Oligoflexales bacterium]
MYTQITLFIYVLFASTPAVSRNAYLIDPNNSFKAVKVVGEGKATHQENVILMRDPITDPSIRPAPEEIEEGAPVVVEPAMAKVPVPVHKLQFREHSVTAKTIKPRIDFIRKSLPLEPDLGYHQVKRPPSSRSREEL